jgi:hypothetical protein
MEIDFDPAAAAAVRRASGSVQIESKLVSFLYELMRDHVPPGIVEQLVQGAAVADVQYTNGWLALYAQNLAGRLTGPPAGKAKHAPQEEGSMLTGAQVATLLGISRQAVDKRRKTGNILGVPRPGGVRYPSMQFVDGDVLLGIPGVLHALAACRPADQLAFILTPNQRLDGKRPLDMLRVGAIERVHLVARAERIK